MVDMITTLASVICIERQLKAEYDQRKCASLPLGLLGKSALRKEGWPGLEKLMVSIKLDKGRERFSKYCQASYIGTHIDFHQLWGKRWH